MNLPYLDTEEKLCSYTKTHWQIDIDPALISAFSSNPERVLIQPSDAYNLLHASLNSYCSGTIIITRASLVHPCVLPVLREAYRKRKQEREERLSADLKKRDEFVLKESERKAEAERKYWQQKIERLQNTRTEKTLTAQIINLFKPHQKK